jgi:hypothetical protein
MATIYGPANPKTGTISNYYGPANPKTGSIGGVSAPSKGSVLGASTSNVNRASTGSSPTQNVSQPQQQNNGGGGGEPDYANEISDMYAPALAALEGAIGVANTGAAEQQKSVEGNWMNADQKVDTESAQLKADTMGRQEEFNKTLQSAFESAVRAYNALKQQGQARFGGGSSAGQALGELANQEYFRQQGNITENKTKGDLQFSSEIAKIGTYVSQKKQDLLQWKNDTLGQIKTNLAQTLQEIAMRKGDIEANKTRDKIGALQAAQQRVQAVRDADNTFRQNLALASINQMQGVTGRAFTPAEIKATLEQWGLGNIGGGATPTYSGPTVGKSNDQYDAFGNLINATG